MKRKPYATVGRTNLLNFFRANPDCQFTTEELCLAVNGSDAAKSTVYRHLTELCRDHVVRKFRSPERLCSVYQYVGSGCDCDEHFHAKCVRCGKLEHLDCEDSADFVLHLKNSHGFFVNCGQSVLYGLCAYCKEQEAKGHA